MISGRAIKTSKDLERVNELLSSNGINEESKLEDSDLIYILEEDYRLLGICKILTNNSYGMLKYIVVSKDFRGQRLGDGLIRSAFNYCIRKGIQEIYYHEINPFLNTYGFKAISLIEAPKSVREKVCSDEILKCNLEEFFSRGCKCKGRD